jgi:predicted house-cleaning noncanonical NTP pyrophosphatase (MazG superfamily)
MAIVNKLVRDKVIDNITQKGHKSTYRFLDNSEFQIELQKKLLEECTEYLDSKDPKELADILEVVFELAKLHKLTKQDLEDLRVQKHFKSGSFDKKIFLIDNDDSNYNEPQF